MTDSLNLYFRKQAQRIEGALNEFLPSDKQHPTVLHEAMRYAVLTGGKRVRPLLTLATCDMLGGDPDEVLIPATDGLLKRTSTICVPCSDDPSNTSCGWRASTELCVGVDAATNTAVFDDRKSPVTRH